MRDKTNVSHVHLARLALADVVGRGEELAADAERAAEVATRAAGDDAQLGVATGPHQAVGHLGNRAVAAQGDDQSASSLGLVVRDRAGVAGRLGEARVEDAQPVGQRSQHGGPAFLADAAARARVDDDDGLVHGPQDSTRAIIG